MTSLGLSTLVALLGYAPLFGMRISQSFTFSVIGGLVSAGLPLAISYSLNLGGKAPRIRILGVIVCGFFAGVALMSLVRLSVLSMPYVQSQSAAATSVLFLSIAVWACVASVLPDQLSSSLSHIGMNALQNLWHGFAVTSSAAFAGSWKSVLALTGFASAAVANVVVALVYAANPAAGPCGPVRWYAFALVCAAAVSFLAPFFLQRFPSAGRSVVLGSVAALVLSSIAVYAGGAATFLGVFACMVLCGIAMGGILTAAIIHFADASSRRSAGAAMGAVVTIWLVPFLVGIFLASTSFREIPEMPALLAFVASLIGISPGLNATRRLPPGSTR